MYVSFAAGRITLTCADPFCEAAVPITPVCSVARVNELAEEHAHYHRLLSPKGG